MGARRLPLNAARGPLRGAHAFRGKVAWESGLLLHRHRDVAVRRETNLVAFHVRHETAVDIVVVAFVPTLAAVSLSQFDAGSLRPDRRCRHGRHPRQLLPYAL